MALQQLGSVFAQNSATDWTAYVEANVTDDFGSKSGPVQVHRVWLYLEAEKL